MKLYRGITLAEGQKINTENIGRSWSLCEAYAEDHVKSATGCYVILSVDVAEDMIDWPNTLLARDRRPKEFEIVLAPGIEIEAEIHFSKHDIYEQFDTLSGSTGHNTFEDYFSDGQEYSDGDVTKEDIVRLVESFNN